MVRGSALRALEGSDDALGVPAIVKLVAEMDRYIPLPERVINAPFLLRVENVYSISGRGTVVTGCIERGVVRVNDEVEIVGLRPTMKSTCTSIEIFRRFVDEGRAGDNAGMLLRGVKADEVERGQVIAAPGSMTPNTRFECEVYVLTKEEGGRHTPFMQGLRAAVLLPYHGRHGCHHAAGRCRDGDAGRHEERVGRTVQPHRDGGGTAFCDPRG